MKKLIVFLCVAGLVTVSASPLFAGGAVNKTNWSAEYFRTLNRNAATDAADITMYNPAGVMKMKDGLYVDFSLQYLSKDYTNKINGIDYDSNEPSFIPGLFALYKKDRWAGFFAVSNVVGGGDVDFENGDATTNLIGAGIIQKANTALAGGGVPSSFWYTGISSQNLNGNAYGLGYTFGGSYQINDMFSISLAAMYVDSTVEANASLTVSATNPFPTPGVNNPIAGNVDYEEDADGWGAVLGINFSPTEQWNIGLRYNTEINLDYDQSVNNDNLGILPGLGITNGGTRTQNLPAIFAAGISYQVNPKIRLETDLTYYFNSSADWGGDEDNVDDGYDLGISLEYIFNKTLKGSIGYLYTNTGVDAKDMLPENPELNANTLATGLEYECIPNMLLNFAIGNVFYEDDSFTTSDGIKIEYEKNVFFMAFGIQYKFM